MIIDFHSHFLPSIDDGARDMEMSLKMLGESYKQGVTDIVSTSHCYPHNSKDIDKFVEERDLAIENVKKAACEQGMEIPKIHKGCEVHLTTDVAEMRSIKKLCINDGRYMLLEMPSMGWSDRIIDCVYKLCLKGITPVIAHMERNLMQKNDLIESLYQLDVMIQLNAVVFEDAHMKKFTDTMFRRQLVHVIGSDMHNLTSRKPNIEGAISHINKRYGNECVDYIMSLSEKIILSEDIPISSLKSFKPKKILGIF